MWQSHFHSPRFVSWLYNRKAVFLFHEWYNSVVGIKMRYVLKFYQWTDGQLMVVAVCWCMFILIYFVSYPVLTMSFSASHWYHPSPDRSSLPIATQHRYRFESKWVTSKVPQSWYCRHYSLVKSVAGCDCWLAIIVPSATQVHVLST